MKDDYSNILLPKILIFIFLILILIFLHDGLGPDTFFLLFEILICSYLYSLYQNKLSLLFFLHPFLSFLSSLGFTIPYIETGVSYTYLEAFDHYVNPSNLNVDFDKIISDYQIGSNTLFSYRNYISVIPIILLPDLLYPNSPVIIYFYSINLFTILYAAVGSTIAISLKTIDKSLLLHITLFATISPTFIEINSSLHRYQLMFFGLYLFFITFISSRVKNTGFKLFKIFLFLIISIFCLYITKPVLILSIFIFLLLYLLYTNNLPFISKILAKFSNNSKVILYIGSFIFLSYITKFIVPEKYVNEISQEGVTYPILFEAPLIGFVLRLIYAILAPFPWYGFTEYIRYFGGSKLLFLLHIFSSFFASWIFISLFFNYKKLTHTKSYLILSILFGFSLMFSLLFSAIGYHVYLAPCLPFLSPILFVRDYRVSPVYPVSFIIIMEIIAQAARFIR
jgi:hypothetical protein